MQASQWLGGAEGFSLRSPTCKTDFWSHFPAVPIAFSTWLSLAARMFYPHSRDLWSFPLLCCLEARKNSDCYIWERHGWEETRVLRRFKPYYCTSSAAILQNTYLYVYIYIYTLSCQCNYKELVKKIHFLEFWNIMRNSRVKTKPKSQAFGFLVSYIPLCLIWGLDIAAKWIWQL